MLGYLGVYPPQPALYRTISHQPDVPREDDVYVPPNSPVAQHDTFIRMLEDLHNAEGGSHPYNDEP